MKAPPDRGLPAEHGGAPREPGGRSAVDATGHDGVMDQADGACVVSAAAWLAAVGFGGCFPPAAQIGLPRSSWLPSGGEAAAGAARRTLCRGRRRR